MLRCLGVLVLYMIYIYTCSICIVWYKNVDVCVLIDMIDIELIGRSSILLARIIF